MSKFSAWRRDETEKLVNLKGDLGAVNTVNITMINAGKQHNVIPETAEASIDIRISPKSDMKEIKAMIDEFTKGISWHFSLEHDSSAISSVDPEDLYWKTINSALIERYNILDNSGCFYFVVALNLK